uniref:Uncharacterized protein n=1 Tax=Knipowitschia caucasica TaxID=637954 RepID=A0AAV2L064_KNICA
MLVPLTNSEEHRDWPPAGTLRSTGTGLLLGRRGAQGLASCWDSEEHRDWPPVGTLRSTGTGLLLGLRSTGTGLLLGF